MQVILAMQGSSAGPIGPARYLLLAQRASKRFLIISLRFVPSSLYHVTICSCTMTQLFMDIGVPGFDFGDIMSAPITEKKEQKNNNNKKIVKLAEENSRCRENRKR